MEVSVTINFPEVSEDLTGAHITPWALAEQGAVLASGVEAGTGIVLMVPARCRPARRDHLPVAKARYEGGFVQNAGCHQAQND